MLKMKDREDCIKFIPGNICLNFECAMERVNCEDGLGCDGCNGPKCHNFDCENCVNYKSKE